MKLATNEDMQCVAESLGEKMIFCWLFGHKYEKIAPYVWDGYCSRCRKEMETRK